MSDAKVHVTRGLDGAWEIQGLANITVPLPEDQLVAERRTYIGELPEDVEVIRFG